MEKEVTQLQESTNLFDVTIPDYKDIKLCRREVTVLKELWDIVVFVQVSNFIYSIFKCRLLEEIQLKATSPLHNTPKTQ